MYKQGPKKACSVHFSCSSITEKVNSVHEPLMPFSMFFKKHIPKSKYEVLANKYTKISILSGFMKVCKWVHVNMVATCIPMPKGVGDTLTSGTNQSAL